MVLDFKKLLEESVKFFGGLVSTPKVRKQNKPAQI